MTYSMDYATLQKVEGGLPEWCMALHGDHDEHQCHKKPGHRKEYAKYGRSPHECYCGVRW